MINKKFNLFNRHHGIQNLKLNVVEIAHNIHISVHNHRSISHNFQPLRKLPVDLFRILCQKRDVLMV